MQCNYNVLNLCFFHSVPLYIIINKFNFLKLLCTCFFFFHHTGFSNTTVLSHVKRVAYGEDFYDIHHSLSKTRLCRLQKTLAEAC